MRDYPLKEKGIYSSPELRSKDSQKQCCAFVVVFFRSFLTVSIWNWITRTTGKHRNDEEEETWICFSLEAYKV